MSYFQLWTHGSSVQIQQPTQTSYTDRSGHATVVEQEPGTENWFHFAIPTLKEQEAVCLKTVQVFLRVRFDRGGVVEHTRAYIDKLHVWDSLNRVLRVDDVTSRGIDWRQVTAWDIPGGAPVEHGVGLSVHVVWGPLGQSQTVPFGRIEFVAAGARFEEF